MLLAVLSAATKRNEVCALVDVSDAFDPVSAQSAGVNFEKLLWVRCGGFPRKKPSSVSNHVETKQYFRHHAEAPVEQGIRVTDLLLQSGGFGLVIIDLGDVPVKLARRIPLTSWFRFQRAVENTPTVLFLIASVPCAQTCASLQLKLQASGKKLSAINCQLSPGSHDQEQSTPSHSYYWTAFRSKANSCVRACSASPSIGYQIRHQSGACGITKTSFWLLAWAFS